MFLLLASRTEHMAEALNCGCAHLDCEDKFANKDTAKNWFKDKRNEELGR